MSSTVSTRTKTDRVAAYIANLIDRSHKTQREIANEAGFDNPNVISMFRSGVTKFPIARIVPFAKATDCDPRDLFRVIMEQYQPEVLAMIDQLYDLTKAEADILARMRMVAGGRPIKLTRANENLLDEFVRKA